MKKLFLPLVFLLSIQAFAAENKAAIKESAAKLQELLLQKKGIFLAKSDSVDIERYMEILKGLYDSEIPFSIDEGIVTAGEKSGIQPYLNSGFYGPEYENNNMIAIRFNVEIDSTAKLEDITRYLSLLPIDREISDFIRENFTNSDSRIKAQGLEFYLATMMATMTKYPGFPKIAGEAIAALEKHPDGRVAPFIDRFIKDYTPAEETRKSLDELSKTIAGKGAMTKTSGPQEPDCKNISAYVETITRNPDKEKVIGAIKSIGEMDCKEAVAYLFFINNFSYVNKGDDLFANPAYFSWDKKNLRYSLDLRKKEQYAGQIADSYKNLLSRLGMSLNEILKIFTTRYQGIWVGVDSVYFDYLFRVPFKLDWELNKKELQSLINNVLYIDAGYELRKIGKIFKLVKSR